jgi:hypothetical protein
MSPTVTVVVVFAAIVAAVLIIIFLLQRRTRLRKHFGTEYDRATRETGNKYRAQVSLGQLEQRVKKLEIRALQFDERARYRQQWRAIQARFIDNPNLALQQGDEIVQEVMETCGYPLTRLEDEAQLSVDHPLVVEHFRKGHEIAMRQARGAASTEEVRQGLIHYRTLFEDLMGERVQPRAAVGANRF